MCESGATCLSVDCCFSAKDVALRRKSRDWWLGIRIMCESGATCVSVDCCFSAKDVALRRKSRDWLGGNQDNV
jgi:ABC-type uncharacterized transport system YnjBCD ATPase subunit